MWLQGGTCQISNKTDNNDKANKRKQNYVCLRFTSIIALLIPSRGEGRRL